MKDLTIKEALSNVEMFHLAFGIKNNYSPTAEIGKDEAELRFKLMQEENEEYLQATKDNDIVEIADALGDQLYVLCGTILKHGLQDVISDVLEEIHRSNLSKLDISRKAVYRNDGKVLKGGDFSAPDIETIIMKNLEQ